MSRESNCREEERCQDDGAQGWAFGGDPFRWAQGIQRTWLDLSAAWWRMATPWWGMPGPPRGRWGQSGDCDEDRGRRGTKPHGKGHCEDSGSADACPCHCDLAGFDVQLTALAGEARIVPFTLKNDTAAAKTVTLPAPAFVRADGSTFPGVTGSFPTANISVPAGGTVKALLTVKVDANTTNVEAVGNCLIARAALDIDGCTTRIGVGVQPMLCKAHCCRKPDDCCH